MPAPPRPPPRQPSRGCFLEVRGCASGPSFRFDWKQPEVAPGAPKRGGHESSLRACAAISEGEIRASPNAQRPYRWDDRPMRPTVLIVDDHASFRASAGALLEAEGFTVAG